MSGKCHVVCILHTSQQQLINRYDTENQTFAFYFLLPSLYYSGLTDAMLIQKINRHDCHEEFAYEDNGDWKAAAAAVDGGK